MPISPLLRRSRGALAVFVLFVIGMASIVQWTSVNARNLHDRDVATNERLAATNAKLRADEIVIANTQAGLDYAAKRSDYRAAFVAWDACQKRNVQSERLVWILASQRIVVTDPLVEKCPPKPAALPPFVPLVIAPPGQVTPTTSIVGRHPTTTTTRQHVTTTTQRRRATTTTCRARNQHSCRPTCPGDSCNAR